MPCTLEIFLKLGAQSFRNTIKYVQLILIKNSLCDELMVCLWNHSQNQNPRYCPEPALDFDHWASPFPLGSWEWLNNLAFLIPIKIQFHVKLESPVGSFQPWSISWWCPTAGPALLEELKTPGNCLKQLQLKFMLEILILGAECDSSPDLGWNLGWWGREYPGFSNRSCFAFLFKGSWICVRLKCWACRAGQSHLWCHKGDIFWSRMQGSHSSSDKNQGWGKFWGQKAALKIALFLFSAAC